MVRIQSIDILRGIAILGILFMNIYFHGSLLTGYGELTPKPLSDTYIEIFNTLFIDGRFRTLFCLLFGAGLAIQYQSCKKQQLSAKVFLTSRLNWLMIFGLFHAFFIFGGDVLILYSVSALTIISSLELPLKSIYDKSRKFLTIGVVLSVLLTAFILLTGESASVMRTSTEYLDMHELWFSSYTYQVFFQGGIALVILITSPLFIYWQVAGLMLLGAFLFRTGFFKKGFKSKQLKMVSTLAALFISLDLLLIFSTSVSDETSSVLSSVSAIFVALIYAHIAIRLHNNKNRFIAIFSAPGKVAFSLYIFQSIVMAILLRHISPDFHLTAQRMDYFIIAITFTVIQIVLAHIYLRYFNQGPLEYLWRRAYQKSLRNNLDYAAANKATS